MDLLRPTGPHHRLPLTVPDVDLLAAECERHGVELAIEWVHEIHPELWEVAQAAGLQVSSYALMTTGAEQVISLDTGAAARRIVPADDAALLQAAAVMDVSFAAGGTACGPQGLEERDAAVEALEDRLVAHLRDRGQRGLTVTAVAESADGVVAAGSYQPCGDLAEVVAVATLPSVRRQGLAALVTAELARHAHSHGIRTLLLSAENDDVARVYQRVGFRRLGTSCAAERISRAKEAGLRAAVASVVDAGDRLSFWVTDLVSDEGRAAATAGCFPACTPARSR